MLYVRPANSIEAEQAALGAMLIETSSADEALLMLKQADFLEKRHQDLFEIIRDLRADDKPCDLVCVQDRCVRLGVFREVGGIAYLIDLQEAAPTGSAIKFYCEIVKDYSLRRKLMQFGAELSRDAGNLGVIDDAEEVYEQYRARFEELEDEIPADNLRPVKEYMRERWQVLDDGHASGSTEKVIGTHLEDVNHYLGGLRCGKLYYIGGRPGQGKTALAVNLLTHACLREKETAVFFSLEMAGSDIVDRIWASEGGVDAFSLSRESLEPEDMERIVPMIGRTEGMPLMLDDTPALSMEQIAIRARRAVRRHKARLVVVDHLQQVAHPRAESLRVGISLTTRALQALAKELNVAMVVTSQLKRSIEKNPRPTLSDFKETGTIEETADAVIGIHHPRGESAPLGPARLIVLKHRQGQSGHDCISWWEPAHTRFRNPAQWERVQAEKERVSRSERGDKQTYWQEAPYAE